MNVAIDVIEKSLDAFTKKYKIANINGSLISGQYVDQIMEELCEMMEESGQIYLSELTTKYNLPLEYLKECV